jgi:hypothetical protein
MKPIGSCLTAFLTLLMLVAVGVSASARMLAEGTLDPTPAVVGGVAAVQGR